GTSCDIIRLDGQQAKLFSRARIVKITPNHALAKITKTLNGYTVGVGDFLRFTPFGESKKIFPHSRSGPPNYRLGVAGGVNFDATVDYSVLANADYSQIKPRITPGFKIGAVLEYCGMSPFILASGLYFSQDKSVWEFDNISSESTNSTDISRQLAHLTIPVTMKIKLGPFYAFSGINFNYFLKATAETGIGPGMNSSWSDQVRKSLMAYDAGLGIEFKLQPNSCFFIEERYTYSNENLLRGTDSLFKSLSFGGHQIMIGYLLGI
ncbi:PorT family protein, partial [bacterium]|nr:PorT family protein [bacterium]